MATNEQGGNCRSCEDRRRWASLTGTSKRGRKIAAKQVRILPDPLCTSNIDRKRRKVERRDLLLTSTPGP